MIPLLKMYDDFTSNKYVSVGISVASTAFMACRTVSLTYYYRDPSILVISACAGIALALLSKYYLAHNERIKNDGERNSIYATTSLIVAFIIPVIGDNIYANILNAYNSFFRDYRKLFSYGSINCFGMGFLVTNLALQILEGKTKFKFQLPFVFE